MSSGLGAQRTGIFALEAKAGVEAVLDDEEAVPSCELKEAATPIGRQIMTGWVVTARLKGQQADLLPRQEPLELVGVQTLLVDRDRQHARARGAQRLEHAHECGGLAGGDVTRTEHGAGSQRQALARPAGDQDV